MDEYQILWMTEHHLGPPRDSSKCVILTEHAFTVSVGQGKHSLCNR